MKNGIIRIVMLTALIAVMIGMTNPSTILGASKPVYSVTVQVGCSGIQGVEESYTKSTAQVTFWGGPKSQANLGSVSVTCTPEDRSNATATFQSSQEPNRWGVTLTILDYSSDKFVCDTLGISTTFPADLITNCYSPWELYWPNPTPPYPPPYEHTASISISAPTH